MVRDPFLSVSHAPLRGAMTLISPEAAAALRIHSSLPPALFLETLGNREPAGICVIQKWLHMLPLEVSYGTLRESFSALSLASLAPRQGE